MRPMTAHALLGVPFLILAVVALLMLLFSCGPTRGPYTVTTGADITPTLPAPVYRDLDQLWRVYYLPDGVRCYVRVTGNAFSGDKTPNSAHSCLYEEGRY